MPNGSANRSPIGSIVMRIPYLLLSIYRLSKSAFVENSKTKLRGIPNECIVDDNLTLTPHHQLARSVRNSLFQPAIRACGQTTFMKLGGSKSLRIRNPADRVRIITILKGVEERKAIS